MKVVSTKLTNPEWEQLQAKCNGQGVTIAEYLRSVIQEGRSCDQPLESEPIVMKEKTKSEIDALFEEKYSELEAQLKSQVKGLETRLIVQSDTISRLEMQTKTMQEKLKKLEPKPQESEFNNHPTLNHFSCCNPLKNKSMCFTR